MEEGVAPTDSRLRPDQRFMENTDWDNANKEKQRLEEKQRSARRLRDKEAELAASEGMCCLLNAGFELNGSQEATWT